MLNFKPEEPSPPKFSPNSVAVDVEMLTVNWVYGSGCYTAISFWRDWESRIIFFGCGSTPLVHLLLYFHYFVASPLWPCSCSTLCVLTSLCRAALWLKLDHALSPLHGAAMKRAAEASEPKPKLAKPEEAN